jgi:putative membrane protein
LINSIKRINFSALKLLLTGHPIAFLKAINGFFLLSVVCGIGISIFSLAKLITWLLVNQPVLVWAFFFGLVLASTWFVSKDITRWRWGTWLAFIIGAVIAYYITIATPTETPTNLPFIFLCGVIAICAMILPGISGSFILVLMGKYFYIMEAVKQLHFSILITFACGAIIGITAFSHVLSYALRKFHNVTLSVLTGFMLGSLNKVWPWKETVETFAGGQKFTMENNVMPNEHIFSAIALMLLGFVIVWFLEYLSSRKK